MLPALNTYIIFTYLQFWHKVIPLVIDLTYKKVPKSVQSGHLKSTSKAKQCISSHVKVNYPYLHIYEDGFNDNQLSTN